MKKFLIIGCGSIGRRHINSLIKLGYKNIAALRSFKGSNFFLDTSIENNILSFENENDAFNWEPTHLIISNPTSLHSRFISLGIKNKINIFVEKPIVADSSELVKIQTELKDANNINLVVGYHLRFNKMSNFIKSFIESQNSKIINVSMSVGHYLPAWHPNEDYRVSYASRSDLGGGVLNTLSHEIDLANFFLGNAYQVTSKIGKLSNLEIDVEDCVDILLSTKDCPRISLHLNYLFPYLIRRGWVLFDDSLLEYDYVEQKVLFSNRKKTKQLIFSEKMDYNDQYKFQMRNFAENKFDSFCNFNDASYVMRVIDASRKSNNETRTVAL